MITQAFDLNMIPSSAPVVVHVDQYDHGEGRFIISLYNGDTPYTPTGTAIIQGTKPDGKGFEYSATLSGNTVTASLTEQMTAVYGIVRAQIVITETSGRTGTFVFNLDVQKSALPADADMSHSEYQIVEELLEDVQQAAADAAQSAENADASAEDSEAWAVGTRDGVPVTPDDPTYHNNSKWWAEHGGGGGGSAHTIVNAKGQDMTARTALKFANMRVTDDATHNQTVVESGSIITITTTESTLYGQNVTLSDGTTTLTEAFSNSGVAVFYGVSLIGNLSISSSDGVDTAIGSITVPYFGIFEKDISFWSATIAVSTTTADFNGLTVYAKKNGVTKGSAVFSSGSANITVPETGSYTLEVTQDWHTYTSQAVTVSAQTTYNASIDGFKAPISLSTPTTDFYGQNIAVSLDGNPITTSLAFDNTGAASFDALVAGTYVFTLTYQGEPYTATVVVTTETSYSGVIKMWTATIKVTASSQLYSQSVTVYKGSTSVGTVTLDATGKADILVHEAGTYYVKGVYDGWTYSTDAISVSAETDYPVTLDIFICTLSISTTSTELYSQTITVTKGGSTVGTTAFSAGGSATFRVHETGTYTLTCTYGGEDYSESITIVSGDDGTTKSISIETIPEGSTVEPPNDIQIWLNCAGIRDKTSYTTLSDVLADHDTLYRLMADDNAVDYLVRSTTWVSGITADEYAMKYIGKWNYASDTLLDDSTWRAAICNSTYFESVLNFTTPTMTGADAPSGHVTQNGYASGYEGYKAFDKNTSTSWANANVKDNWLKYEFPEAVKIYRSSYLFKPISSSSTWQWSCDLAGSNDDITYNTIDSFTTTTSGGSFSRDTAIGSPAAYKYYKLSTSKVGGTGNNTSPYVGELELYGRTDVTENLIDIYSAASDTISITGNDISLVVETDTTGYGSIAKSSLPNGTYTFTSLVAKDLPNGSTSDAYSKQITITDISVVDGVYVMPDGAVYWYGWTKGEIITNNSRPSGTTSGGSVWNKGTPPCTINTNDFYIKTTGGTTTTTAGMVVVNQLLDLTGYTNLKGYLKAGNGSMMLADSLSDGYNRLTGTASPTGNTSIFQTYTRSINSGATSGYAFISAQWTSSAQFEATVSALWLE